MNFRALAKIIFISFRLNMDITFGGIKNFIMLKTRASGYGTYMNNAGILTEGEKNYDIIKFDVDLNNDVFDFEKSDKPDFKPHLVDYLTSVMRMKNSRAAAKILSYDEPYKFSLLMKRFSAEDEYGTVKQSMFYLNNEPIPLTDRSMLPLYTSMARITRDVQKVYNFSDSVKNDIKLINDSISDVAEEFIDNM